MMVVVAIMGLVAATAIPSITSYFQISLTSASRELASTVKETYNSTVITGQVHRMVYDFKDKTYWVESGPAGLLLDTKESLQRQERKRRFVKESDADQTKDKPSFQLDKSITRKKIALPTGVAFEDVFTQQSPTPITEGKAFTHFFPHGMIEQTIVHIRDESKHHVSLVINPIVGKTDMYERYLTSEEAFGARQ